MWFDSIWNKVFNKKFAPPVSAPTKTENTPEPDLIPLNKIIVIPSVAPESKYTDRFVKFMPFILEAETVFQKRHYLDYKFAIMETVKGDSGGDTKFGIDAASHPGVNIKNLTLKTATDIYFKEWKEANIEQYNFPFGECVFDCNVNSGAGRTKSIMKITGTDSVKFLKEREAFYNRLANSVPKDKVFLKGWINRITNLATYLKINLN